MTKPNFANDLKSGQAGELAVQKLWPELELLHGHGADAKLPDGTLVEIKCDSYDHSKTENFFMEYIGSIESGKLGGPWKAEVDKCKYFIYYFSSHKIAYIFETAALLEQLNVYILHNTPKLVEIQNKRWVTVGYKIPRSALAPLRVLRGAK